MAVRPDFESAFSMRMRIRAQQRRIAELESGAAVARLEREAASMRRSYEAKAKRLERELAAERRSAAKMRKCWFEVFEQVERERDEAVSHAMASARRMEERALRAERQRDEAAAACTGLRRLCRDKDAEIEDLKGRLSKLQAQAARDFENSSLPSSAQGPGRKRVPNTRKPTGRRPGAQPGHPHHPRRRPEPDAVVEVPDPPGFGADPDLYRTGAAASRAVVSARLEVRVTEYRAAVWRSRSTGSRLHAPFPACATCEVSYDGSAKALAFLLTTECGASAAKASAFLREASGGRLRLSDGLVKGLAREFSLKSAPERAEALAALMAAPVMHADFTCANVGGEGAQVLILANPRACAMVARGSKGHKGVEGTPLQSYAGCAVHDHDTTFYSYGTSHQECMQHNVRYLVGSVQDEPRLSWNGEMLSLLREMLHWRKSLGSPAALGPAELAAAAEFERRYDEVLDLADREYAESPPSKYCREGYNLSRRLRKYKESELRFLTHPEVPPDNSLCERLARVFKRKQHQAIAFRSLESLGCVCDSISAVNNMRVAGKDVFAEASAVFDRPLPQSGVAADGSCPDG